MEIWDWPPSAGVPRLADGDVHVWRAALNRDGAEVEQLARLLTAAELARTDRYRFERDRSAFIVRRGVLRALCGGYLRGGPFRDEFEYNPYGMPHMPPPHKALRFNLSHSAGAALFAFALRRRVGIDIEAVRADIDACEIAESFFSPAERRALASLDAEQQQAAFFAGWSRKEAYIKAQGIGLSLPLDSFDVSLAPGERALLLATRPDPAEAGRWRMEAIDVGPGFAAALVVEVGTQSLCLRE